VQKITYGESSTTQSISRILDYVTENYNYTSLKELNNILKLYNVEAYRGSEDSKLYQNRGLLYRVLDDNGRYVGVPIKASFFDSKPTLDNLEKKMIQNQTLKLQQEEQRLQQNIQDLKRRLKESMPPTDRDTTPKPEPSQKPKQSPKPEPSQNQNETPKQTYRLRHHF